MTNAVVPAELLLSMAEGIKRFSGLMVIDESLPANTVEVAALALRLRDRPALALRAVVEEWDKARVIRELW